HVRNAVLDVRHYLSVCDVAPPTADAHVLATRLVGVSDPAFHRFQPSRGPAPVLPGIRGESVHLPPRPHAWARALADDVGMRPRGGDDLSARLGLDSLRKRAGSPRPVSNIRVRISDQHLSRRIAVWIRHLPWT